MHTTIQLLDLLRDKLGSDYRTGKVMDIDQSRVSKMRTGKGVFTDTQGLEVAKILGLKEEYVLLSLAAERADNGKIQKILISLADKFQPKAVAATFLFSVFIVASLALPSLPITA